MKDTLGKRMKDNYEYRTRMFLPRRTYTLIRLDGKAFHTFTKGMKRPFDEEFANVMNRTATFLCKEIQGAQFAYVQSDEISILLTDFDKITTDAWFDGNIQKIASVSASIATAYFNRNFMMEFAQRGKEIPLAFFDSRVWTIPDPVEVENYFIWRQKDAVRNSISMLAQSLISHKELHSKSQSNMHDMIHEKGENWNDMPEGFKRGRTIRNVMIVDPELVKETNTFDIKFDWKISTPDFLKEREIFENLIPKIEKDE